MANAPEFFTLTIKSTDDRSPALTLQLSSLSTILDLKTKINVEHARKPILKDQRIIFGGKTLDDSQSLQQVFQKSTSGSSFTVHLVLDSDRNSTLPKSVPSGSIKTKLEDTTTNETEPRSVVSTYEQYISQLNQYQQQLHQYLMNPLSIPFSDIPAQSQAYHQYCLTHFQVYSNFLASQRANTNTTGENATTSSTAPSSSPPPPPAPAAAAAAAVPPVNNNNEFEQENDLLGILNMLAELFVLCSIIYFYSTFNRFLVVFFIFALLYLHCRGYLSLQQRRRVAPAPAQANEGERDENQAEAANNETPPNPRQQANDGARATEPAPVTPARLFITAISTFFSSLIPERPQRA